MEFRTYFVCSQKFSYKFKSNELPQSLDRPWLAKSVEDQKRVELSLKYIACTQTLFYFSFRSFSFHPQSMDFEEKIGGL